MVDIPGFDARKEPSPVPMRPNPRFSRRSFLLLSAGAAMSSILAACGSSSTTPDSGQSGSGEQSSSSTTSGAGTPGAGDAPAMEGGTAIFASAVGLPNIDPAVFSDFATATAYRQLYDTLFRYTGDPPEMVPWLATQHEASADAKVWTISIDERAKFQDGSPVTAEAVVYTTERLLKIGQRLIFYQILSPGHTTAVDDRTVRYELDQAYAPFLGILSGLHILNPAVVKAQEVDGDLGKAWLVEHSAGSGPFKIKSWTGNSRYEFEADPNYWRGWNGPHLDGYVYQVSQESSTKRIALTQGQIHAADWLSPEDLKLLQETPNIVVPQNKGYYMYYVKLNNSRGPTADVHVRRAMSYAFDYKAMLDVMGGFAARTHGPLPPTFPESEGIKFFYDTDIEKAKQELAQSAEWKDGFEIEYQYVAGLDEERQCGLILIDQLSALNIKVTVTPVQWANASASFKDLEKSPLMFPIYNAASFPDPDSVLWGNYHSSYYPTAIAHYKNPDLDKLLEQGRATTDPQQRSQVYQQAQALLIDQAVDIFCFTQLQGLVHRDVLQGTDYCPVSGSWWDFAKMSLTQ